MLMINAWAFAGSATPLGFGQEQGYEQPTLACASCYQVRSPSAGTGTKEGISIKGTSYSQGQQVIPARYASFTYAPSWYVGLGNYYRHRGPFSVYAAKNRLGDERGLSIVHQEKLGQYVRGSRPNHELVDGKMMRVN